MSAPPRRRPETGGYTRGDEAQSRILKAALEAFGANGFDGASTRAIAERAGVKLPALHYYFGSKDRLYRACAEYIAATLGEKLSAAILTAQQVVASRPTRATAIATLNDLLGSLADVLVGGAEPELWVMFIIREQASPTPAFDLIYDRAIGKLTRICVSLVAAALECPPSDPEARVRAFGLLGQYLSFRAARATALRTLGWRLFDQKAMSVLKSALETQTNMALGGSVPTRAASKAKGRKVSQKRRLT